MKNKTGLIRKVFEHELTILVSIVAIVIAVVNYIVIPIKLQGQQLDIIQTTTYIPLNRKQLK